MKSITVTFTDDESKAFALFLRNSYIEVYRSFASNDKEAFLMFDASAKIEKALEISGVRASFDIHAPLTNKARANVAICSS
jgi:hypothetical protein